MKITKERFEDAGEQDEDGFYDYYYAGFYFRFEEGEEGFVVRQYEDELEQASFQCCTVQGERVWIGHQFGCIPYDNALFRGAVRYLAEEEGVRQVKILLQGYEAVDIHKATSIDS